MFQWDKDALTFYKKHDTMFKGAMIFYLPVINTAKELMAYNTAYKIETPIKAWNTAFLLFNMAGTYNTLPTAFQLKFNHDYADSNVGKWVFYLNVSKIIEMWDVAFLVLKKKPVPFLHVYHHLFTLLFCYLCSYTRNFSGYWNASINYFVHMFMYAYLLLPKNKYKNILGKLVARAHVVEMILGLGINILSLFYRKQNKVVASIGIGMYASYLYLFARQLPQKKGELEKTPSMIALERKPSSNAL
jgi:hypothetical protein